MNGLINLEVKILTLFRRLCALEIKGLKNSNKYYNILADLKKKIKAEEELVSNLDINDLFYNKFDERLKDTVGIDEVVEAIEIRVSSMLATSIINAISEETGEKQISINDKVLSEAQTNFSMFTAKFLRESIDSEEDEITKNKMIVNFYDLCHIVPRLGTLLLEDSFEIRDEYFMSCYFVADILKVDRNVAQELIDNFCAELLFRDFAKLFFDEKYVSDDDRQFGLNMFLTTFRAFEVMISDDAFARAKNATLKSIEENNLSTHMNCDFVINLFSEQNQQKKKIPTITFGTPLN